MKRPRYAGANHLRFAIVAIMAFFFLCGEVHAQAQTAVINPTGGTALDNNLRIEVRDSCILVRRKGVDQYNLDNSLPQEDIGLRTYFILEQRFGPLQEKTPKYVKACEISDVYGDGSLGNPYKIVTLSSFQNLNNATYNVTTVYTYVNGTSYYNIDFHISSNEEPLNGPIGAERGGQYYIHIYLSQRNWMGTEDCSTGFFSGETSVVFDQYLNQGMPDPALTIKSIVGYKRENVSCPSGPEGVNVFKTNAGFTSWFAGPTNTRDTKVNPGYLLSNNINIVPQAQGVAVHKAIFMDATAMEINHAIKRFAVGFDSTELKSVFVQDPNPPPGFTHFPFGKATIELSDANPSGPEGDNTHVISNLTLQVSGAKFNLPQLATVKVYPTTSGTNDAVAGTDYEVLYTKILIPPGDYTFVPGNFPLNNILIKGDDDLDPNKTLRVELTNDCSPHLQLGAVSDVIYTIEDDDANDLFIEPAQTTLEEGKSMKVKVRMSGTPLLTDVVVTLTKGTANAESTDHSVIPATVTIPAGSLFYEFDFDAIADRILEPATESLDITATATISGINRTHTTTISIIDTTGLNPANKIITFTSPATTEGNNATITASLPMGVTTELPIVIATTEDFSSTTDPTDFGVPFPSSMTIPAAGNNTSFILPVASDAKLELQESLVYNGSITGFVVNSGQLDVIQEAVNLTLEFGDPAITQMTEGDLNPKIVVRLPYATDFAFDVELEIDPTSTVSATDYYYPDPADFKIHFTPGMDYATFDLFEILPDSWLELQEKLVIKASSPGFTATTATLLVNDYNSTNPLGIEYFLEMVDPMIFEFTEGETVQMKIKAVGYLSSEPVVFNIGTANIDPNITAADYELPLTVTIPPFADEVIFDVKAKTDAFTETDEELVVTADASVMGNPVSLSPLFIYIKDGINPVIEFTASDVTEGGTATVTATLQSGVALTDIVITPQRVSGSAIDDDIVLPATVTILAGSSSSLPFTISAVADDILERQETLELGGTATGYIIAPVTLHVNDVTSTVSANKNITLTPVTTDVTEGNTVKVWVRLPGSITTSEELSIDLATSSVTLLGAEYTLPANVKIPAGGHEISFDLVANTDNVLEPDELLDITASSRIFDEDKTATTQITIKDATGTAANKTITVGDPKSIAEGLTANYVFSLPLGITTQDPLVIQLTPGPGTDAAAGDFVGNVYPLSVTIPANDNDGTLSVQPKVDGIIENQEKLILVPSSLGYTFTKNVDLDIIDADLAGATIVLSAAASNVAEGSSVRITATIQGSLTSATPISVVLSKDFASVAGVADHGALGAITIAAGDADGFIDITANTDLILEDTESLILNGTATGFAVTGTTVNITDATGTSANKQLTLTPDASTVAEGGSIQVKVSLPTNIITSEAQTISLTSGTGTVATLLGTEYTLPATVTIPANGNEATFTLTANTDQIIEPNETLEIKATATIFGEAVSTSSNVSITDVTASKLITITGATSVTEGSNATITFSLPGGITTAEALDIDLPVAGTSTALPADFNGVFPTKVTIPANGDHIDLTLSAKTDGIIEALEKLELIPSAAGGFTFDKNVKLDVVDNDLSGASILLTTSSANLLEGGTATITATLQGGLTAGSDLIIALSKAGTSAVADDEHNALTTITIPATQSAGTFTLTANTDDLLEPSENLDIEGAVSGFTVIPVTVNITDLNGQNSNNKIFTITPVAASIAEGSSTVVKISLPSPHRTQDALTITLSRGALSSASLQTSEYNDFTGSVVIPAGGNEVTFNLDALTDNSIEPTEQLQLEATAMVYGTSITAKTTVSITDVTPSKLITITGATSVTEGSNATITFSLPGGITTAEALDIDLPVAGTSTALPADFNGVFPTKVTIPANGDHIDLTLSANTDGVIEALEKLELIPSAAGGFTFNKNVELDVVDNDAAGATIVLSAAASNVAEGSSVRITATIQGSLTSATPINVVLSKDFASVAGVADHGALGTITIAAGDADGFIDITANTDLILENTESLILNGTATGFTITGTTVNITDATGTSANKQLTLTPDASTVAEGGSIQVKVSLPTNIITSEAQTISLTSGTGTVATLLGTEYTLPATVTIPANGNEATFTLTANTDQIIEPNETLEIRATATIFGEAVSTSSNVSITDVTASKLITITGATTVTEGNSTTVIFSLPAGITTAEAIEINLAPGANTPAVVAADLNGGIPDKVIIAAGGNDATLTIQANTDGVIETVEKLHLIPSAAGGVTFSQDVLLDVLDETHSGTITFTSNTASVLEANGVATITVSLPGALTAGSDIQVNISKGSSTASISDHSALPASVTITTGQHETTFTVSAPLDLILEGTENLVLEGSALGYGVSGTTIQILDSTRRDPLNTVISLHPNGGSIAEGTTGHFYVSLPPNIESSTPIAVQLAKVAASSTAADTDHTNIPASITIPANSNTSANFDISAVIDGIIEPLETVQVDGVVPAGFTFASASIDITDATGLTLANRQIRITIDSTILHEGNTSKVTFALPTGITSATDIAITVSAYSGFPANAADFTLTPNTVILPKDVNEVTVVLEAIEDNTDEPDEQLKLIGAAAGFTVLHSNIINIPGSGAPAVTVTAVKTTDASEPSTPGVFTIKLPGSAAAPADITVNYTVTGSAVSNEDYEPLSGVAIIKAGDNGVTVPVVVKDDQIIEGDETLQLTLQSASFVHFGNTITASADNTGGAGMLILDDENIAEGRKILIEKVSDASEPSNNGSVRVRFAHAQFTATVPVTVTYTVSGTATADVDYNALSGTVIIPAGDHDAIIHIVPKDDTDLEGTETIIIQLTGASAGLPLATQQQATVNLADNDMMTVEVSAPASVTEGTTIPVKVRASQITPVDMPVTISLQHDAFRTVTTSATFTIIIPANQQEATLNVVLDENDINDNNGFVNLAILPFAGAGQPYGIGTKATAATIVTDNDPLEISFKVDTVRVKEGNAAITPLGFTVKLSRMSSRAINLNYQFADAFEGAGADRDPMRARAGEDFQSHITSLAIAPMQLEAEIVVPVIGDVDSEIDQLFAIRLLTATVASSENAPSVVNPLIAIGVIQNDDQPIEMEIKVNKGLSPNGDGKNDVLFIENLEKYVQNEIVIVNRWGGTIFKTSNYNNQSNNFSGRANTGGGSGSNLPDGSYFYVLHVWDSSGNMTRHTGYIVLKR